MIIHTEQSSRELTGAAAWQALSQALSDIEAEMRHMSIVAGQCAVEGPQDTKALMANAEAERLRKWADRIKALHAKLPSSLET